MIFLFASTPHKAAAQEKVRLALADGQKQVLLNKLFNMQVVLEAPESWRLVQCDAFMREHNHGMMVRPVIEKLSAQRYLLRGMKFHMPGLWTVVCEVADKDLRQKVSFDYKL